MPDREVLKSNDEKRYIRRDEDGRFTGDQGDVGRSSAADQRQDAENESRKGQGDRGDRPPA